MVKLETWADRVAAPSAPRFLVSKRSGQSKLCDEALPEPSLMHHKNKSYDEARLTHVQVVEATQGLGKFNEDERDAIKDTSLWQSLRQWSRELMGSMPASLFFAGLILGGPKHRERERERECGRLILSAQIFPYFPCKVHS